MEKRENRELYTQIRRAKEKKLERRKLEDVPAGCRFFYPEGLKGKTQRESAYQTEKKTLQMAMTR